MTASTEQTARPAGYGSRAEPAHLPMLIMVMRRVVYQNESNYPRYSDDQLAWRSPCRDRAAEWLT